jgi:hypothetical protein
MVWVQTLSIVILKSYFSHKLIVQHQEAKYVESWPNTTVPGLAGADVIFQWIGMVEYVPCYSARELHWCLLPATRLASRKLLIEQNIKKRTGPALCVLCGSKHQTSFKEKLEWTSVLNVQ